MWLYIPVCVGPGRKPRSQIFSWRGSNIRQAIYARRSVFLNTMCGEVKVSRMKRLGTGAIRTQLQPSKPKRKITKITNSQNTNRTHGQPSEQLFPKRFPLSNPNRTNNNINKHKVKRPRHSDNKNRQQRTTTELPPWNGQWINYFWALTSFTAPNSPSVFEVVQNI